MSEHTVFECDLTGRRARNKNVMEELLVAEASDKWNCPYERTYHVHIEEVLDWVKEREMEFPDETMEYLTLGDIDGPVSVDLFCYENGEVVGVIGKESRIIGQPPDGNESVFVDREELSAYHELMATLVEDELHHDR